MRTDEIIERALGFGAVQNREELTFLLNFLIPRRIHHVLEIGTERGGTFSIWQEIATGKKISIDIPTSASPFVAQPERDLARFCLQRDDSFFIEANSHSDAAFNKVLEILKDESLDLLFIDGDHHYEDVYEDFYSYRMLVQHEGVIVFHDVMDTEEHRGQMNGAVRFWQELTGNKIETMHQYGIGILEVGG